MTRGEEELGESISKCRSKADWEPDGHQCTRCHTVFSILHRRHHCRYCGRLVCAACSTPSGLLLGNRLVRVCADCVDGRPSVLDPRGLLAPDASIIHRRPATARNKEIDQTAGPSCKTLESEFPIPQSWSVDNRPSWATFVQRKMFRVAHSVWLEGFGRLEVKVVEAAGLCAADLQVLNRHSDPYVVIEVEGQKRRTEHILRSLHPRWNETFHLRLRCPWAPLRLWIYDWDRFKGDDFLGVCEVLGEKICRLQPEVPVRGWLRVKESCNPLKSSDARAGGLLVELTLRPLQGSQTTAEKDLRWRLLWAFLAQAGWDPCLRDESESFDPDAAYADVARLVDAMWTRSLLPGATWLASVLKWDDWRISLRWLLIAACLSQFPQWFWFAWTCWTAFGLRKRILERRENHPLRIMKRSSPSLSNDNVSQREPTNEQTNACQSELDKLLMDEDADQGDARDRRERWRRLVWKARSVVRPFYTNAVNVAQSTTCAAKAIAEQALCTQSDEEAEAAEELAMSQAIANFTSNPSRSLGGWAAPALRMCVPSRHQATIASLQPKLRRWANNVDLVEDILKGRHYHSRAYLKCLYVSALLQLWPFSTHGWLLFWVLIWFMFFSPVMTMLEGFLSMRRHHARIDLQDIFDCVGQDCPLEWHSLEAARLKRPSSRSDASS